MPHPFSHPSSENLFKEARDVFQSIEIYRYRDQHFIFVCGGSTKKYSRSLRKRFLKFAAINLKQYRFFLAEDATKDLTQYDDYKFVNIASYETLIADISHCILIIPESAGSIAETGYFSNNNNALKKILIVNDTMKQKDSFINLGPINKIERHSIFQPTILTDLKILISKQLAIGLQIGLSPNKRKNSNIQNLSI